jgi:predicted dithiol-disulfide oxidoreductase (DUF899 family)
MPVLISLRSLGPPGCTRRYAPASELAPDWYLTSTRSARTPGAFHTRTRVLGGRSQLLVYPFMFGPEDTEGCGGCSLSADHFDGPAAHLNAKDVTFVSVSRGRLEAMNAYKKRMGWRFDWVSSLQSDFNYDFGVSFHPRQRNAMYNFEPVEDPPSELPGMSAFALEDGVYHTYSSFGRGGDVLIGMYQLLDRAPLGRNEEGSTHHPMEWVRRHDEYEGTRA